MESVSFTKIPHQYQQMKYSISEDLISRIYSKFDFLYYTFNHINSQENEKASIKYIYNYLRNFRFITYNIIKTDWLINKRTESNDENLHFTCAVICVENKCIIIEKIKKNLLLSILYQIKSEKQISIINTDIDCMNENVNVRDEIINFCSNFQKVIKYNIFLKNSITPIIGYLIRRYYYPKFCFKDPSFFIFNDGKNSKQQIEINDFLFPENEVKEPLMEKINKEIMNDIEENGSENNKKRDFQDSEFILLRKIYSNTQVNINLVFHKKSMYIFTLREFLQAYENSKEFKHEVFFCENYSHRCFTKFYGFLKKEDKKIGFVYEFMSNDNLYSFIKNNYIENYHLFSMMTINRIFQGINYLHMNSLIHRDLKPKNILINHDFLPFISDFETIRKLDNDEQNEQNDQSKQSDQMTADIGSILYTSPEQDGSTKYTFSSDIYSFGLIIYFVIEKKNMWECTGNSVIKNKAIKPLSNCSISTQKLYEKCLEFSPQKRPDCKYIKEFMFDKIYKDDFFANYIRDLYNNIDKINTIHFLYEGIYICPTEANESEKDFSMYNSLIQVKKYISLIFFYIGQKFYYENNFIKARFFYEISAQQNNYYSYVLGFLYENGIGIKQDLLKAVEYYALSSEKNNYMARFNLGFFYLKGIGIQKNYQKAIECFQLAYEHIPIALIFLGRIFTNGLGVAKDFPKAKYYYELAAEKNIPDAYNSLGKMYFFGQGVEKNYATAKFYFEQAAKYVHSDALCYLGHFYEMGYGAKQDFPKAIMFYKSSARQKNSDAFVRLGQLYYYGRGVDRDIMKAIKYYKYAAKLDNANAFFLLGEEYLNTFHNYQKAIKYYTKCSNIHEETCTYYCNSLDGTTTDSRLNIFRSRADNNLGLIYLIMFNNFEIGIQYIKKSAFSEFPHGQNNFGLINQFYLKNMEMAEYMYKKASRSKFALAEFNLGFLYENNGKIKESLFFFKQAIEHENEVIMYHKAPIIDTDLNISKSLIISLAKLKLALYYLNECDHDEFKKYFFQFWESQLSIGIVRRLAIFRLLNGLLNLTLTKHDKYVTYLLYFQNQIQMMDHYLSDNKLQYYLNLEIQMLLILCKKLIYDPPYHILFGRWPFKHNTQITKKNKKPKNINELFYEGFGQL